MPCSFLARSPTTGRRGFFRLTTDGSFTSPSMWIGTASPSIQAKHTVMVVPKSIPRIASFFVSPRTLVPVPAFMLAQQSLSLVSFLGRGQIWERGKRQADAVFEIPLGSDALHKSVHIPLRRKPRGSGHTRGLSK